MSTPNSAASRVARCEGRESLEAARRSLEKPIGTSWGRVVWLLTCVAGPALGDCLATYPADRVIEKVADPRYDKCSNVANDYVELLREQGALLDQLRPAYQRKVIKDAAQPGGTQAAPRLKEFDVQRANLTALAAGPPNGGLAPASAAASASRRAAARQWLAATQEASKSLNARVSLSLDEFRTEEVAVYCKQDYVLRVAGGLRTKYQACLGGD